MREIPALLFLIVGLVVVHFTAGKLSARWVALAVLGSIAVNRWLPRYLRTRPNLSTRWVGVLVYAGGALAVGSAMGRQ